MSDVEILREAVPTVRWWCRACGHRGPRYDNDHGQGESTARDEAAFHPGQCRAGSVTEGEQ